MTGLTETEYLVAALESGGVDYVTKPIKPKEVMARMGVHLQGARERRQTRNALDAFGYATITVRASDGYLLWQTPLARDLLATYFGTHAPQTPPEVAAWLLKSVRTVEQRGVHAVEPPKLSIARGVKRLTFRLHQRIGDSDAGGDRLTVMRDVSNTAVIEAMGLTFKQTTREGEVLYRVVKGKTNKDIGDIFGGSPMTVKKHLERVFVKLGMERGTAAAGMAVGRIRHLQPHFEG